MLLLIIGDTKMVLSVVVMYYLEQTRPPINRFNLQLSRIPLMNLKLLLNNIIEGNQFVGVVYFGWVTE